MTFPRSDSEIPGSLIQQQSTWKAAAIILGLQLIYHKKKHHTIKLFLAAA